MATYPIKMLKDETGVPFVPLVSSTGITSPDGTTLEDSLAAKIEVDNIIAGDNIILEKDGNNITITGTASGAANVVINNLETTEAKQGVLDAYQGYVLNNKITEMAETLEGGIPEVINNLTTVDTVNALSAYQGYLLNNKFNDYALKSSLDSYALSSSLSSYLLLSGGTMSGTLATKRDSGPAINFRTGLDGYDGCISYETAGNEALVFSTKNPVTSFMFVNGEDIVTNASPSRWQSLTPGLQIKYNKVSIGALIADGKDIDYRLQVAGTIKADAFTTDGTCALLAHHSNELNFGGTSDSDTIFFGYRAAGSRPQPVKYVFGTGSGTAGVWGGSFYKQGINVPGVYVQSGQPSAKQTGDIWFKV